MFEFDSFQGTEYTFGQVKFRVGVFNRRNHSGKVIVVEIQCLDQVKAGAASFELDHYVSLLRLPESAEPISPNTVLNGPEDFGPAYAALQHIRLFEAVTGTDKLTTTGKMR